MDSRPETALYTIGFLKKTELNQEREKQGGAIMAKILIPLHGVKAIDGL